MANNLGLGFIFTGTDRVSGPAKRSASAIDQIKKSAEQAGYGAAALDAGLKKIGQKRGGLSNVAQALSGGGGAGAGARAMSRNAYVPKGAKDSFRDAQSGAAGLNREVRELAKGAGLSQLAFNALGTAMGNLGASVVANGLRGVKNSIVGSAAASIDFESAMADVNKVLPEGTELKPISDGAKQLAKDIGLAPVQVANLTASLAQSGIAGDELTLVAGDASRLAVAFGISGEESGQALAKLRTGLGLSRPEVNSLTGTINELSNKLAATAPAITDAVQRVGSVAKAANISAEAAAGLATAMIASGATAEVAATGTKTFLRSLGAGSAATKRQKLAFRELGLDAVDVAKRLTAGGLSAEATIKDVVSRIGDLDRKDKLPNLIRLFGSESIGAIGPLAGNVKLLGQAFGIATDRVAAQGSVLKEYETRSKTTGAAIDRLKANFAVLAIEIGDQLKPAVVAAVDGLEWLIDKSRVWGVEIQALGGRVSDFVTGFDIFKDIKLVFEGLVQVFSQGGFSGAVRKELDRAENSGLKKFVIRVYMLFGRLRVFFEGVAAGFGKAWEIVGPKVTAVFESLKKVFVTVLSVFGVYGDEVATSSMNSWRVWGDALAQSIGTVAGWVLSLIGFFADLLAENEWLVKSLMFGYVAFKAVRTGIWLVSAAAVVSKKILYAYGVAARVMGTAMKIAAVGMKVFRLAVMGVTFVMKALKVAILSNPIVIAIAAIVVGAALIYEYWEPIKGFFVGLWDTITGAFKTAIDWILEQIKWVAEEVEGFLVSVMTPEQAEMYVKMKADTAALENAGSSLFDDDLDKQTGSIAPRNDALSRAQIGASQAGTASIADKVRAQVDAGATQAALAGRTFAQRMAEAKEMSKSNAETGGAQMSTQVNLVVDGAVLASTVAKHGKNAKARTFSNVDPRDEEE